MVCRPAAAVQDKRAQIPIGGPGAVPLVLHAIYVG